MRRMLRTGIFLGMIFWMMACPMQSTEDQANASDSSSASTSDSNSQEAPQGSSHQNVVIRRGPNWPEWPSESAQAATQELLSQVSADAIRQTIQDLVAFETRHTLSDTQSNTRGIGAARRYLLERFKQIAIDSGREGALLPKVTFDRHIQPADGRRIPEDAEIVNVVFELPGTDPDARSRKYYVIGHYDSRASDPMDSTIAAPGANDDASGVALTVELARVLASSQFASTLVFMPTAGEEQGLYGAELHAKAAEAQGIDIRAVLSNDMVGDPTSPLGEPAPGLVRIFSEPFPASLTPEEISQLRRISASSDSTSRQLARYVAEVGELYKLPTQAMLVFRTDRFLRGGDHTAFNQFGFPAVRFTEVYENYDRQHQDVRLENGTQYGDLIESVDETYVANVAKLNLVALTHLANAPSTPTNARIIVAELMAPTILRWDASPESDVAGYEVVWRDTTSPVWQHAIDAKDKTEITVPISKDNVFFGVRAYNQEGYRSPVAFPIAARE